MGLFLLYGGPFRGAVGLETRTYSLFRSIYTGPKGSSHMAVVPLTLADALREYENKDIKEICDCQYVDKSINHCAHFVSHALGLSFGYTCKGHTGKGSGVGASLRVHEIFSRCQKVGKWKDRGAAVTCLVFITAEDHVDLSSHVMVNHPQKHIGIFSNGSVWHYSNGQDQVVKQTPEQVLERFDKIYQGKVELFYGTFPTGAKYPAN